MRMGIKWRMGASDIDIEDTVMYFYAIQFPLTRIIITTK